MMEDDMDENRLREAADTLNDIIHSDVGLRIPIHQILHAFEEDGAVPSEDEMETLVMGDDDGGSGEIPPALVARYPHLDVLLNRSLT